MPEMSPDPGLVVSGVYYSVLAVCGLFLIALLVCCIRCCHRKTPTPVAHRPAPPSPEMSQRYESGLFPSASNQQIPQRNDEDSEEDFEEVFPQGAASDPRTQTPPSTCGQNSSKQDSPLSDINSQGTYVNLGPDYVNVNISSNAPGARKDHTYLEVIPSDGDGKKTEVTVGGDATEEAARETLNSGTDRSLPDSRCHSYENIGTCATHPTDGPSLDYVNVLT